MYDTIHNDLKQYSHLLYFFIAMGRRQATILSIKIPLFKKLSVDLQSFYYTEDVYFKDNTHSHTHFLSIR